MGADTTGNPDQLPIIPIAITHARCVSGCMLRTAAGEAISGNMACFDVKDNAKECALDCLNRLKWGEKVGAPWIQPLGVCISVRSKAENSSEST